MRLEFYYPLWGSEMIPLPEYCEKLVNAGYQGVEAFIPDQGVDGEEFRKTLEQHGLKFIAQHALTLEPDFRKHREIHTARLRRLAALQPEFLSSQTGRDYFSFEQNRELLAVADEISGETGVPIIHETHRGRFSFAAHALQPYLEALPELKLTLDISHWCVVSESLLEDQEEAVTLALSRTEHVHARVGAPQTPQIIDPRSPVWQSEVSRHLGWWRRVAQRYANEKRDRMTLTVEFGPVPYTTVHPKSGKPLLGQWEANLAIREILQSHLSDLLE
ncbi:MAG: sugar phosphate isomerase/epimerase family protein [Spirochaetaceae bacterium]